MCQVYSDNQFCFSYNDAGIVCGWNRSELIDMLCVKSVIEDFTIYQDIANTTGLWLILLALLFIAGLLYIQFKKIKPKLKEFGDAIWTIEENLNSLNIPTENTCTIENSKAMNLAENVYTNFK